jgi:hypothetical protein
MTFLFMIPGTPNTVDTEKIHVPVISSQWFDGRSPRTELPRNWLCARGVIYS